MKNYVVFKPVDDNPTEMTQLWKHPNHDYVALARRHIPTLINRVTLCSDDETTSWGATISNDVITLPTGEKICFDEYGHIIRAEVNGRVHEKQEFWENSDTIVHGKDCKIIYSNDVCPDGTFGNVTIILWKPEYNIGKTETKCGVLAYQHQLVVFGTTIDKVLFWKEENADAIEDNTQLIYEQLMGAFLHTCADNIEVVKYYNALVPGKVAFETVILEEIMRKTMVVGGCLMEICEDTL